MEYPLVSILITSYNRASYIEAAIESALQQTYPNIEIIVTDNCSTDGTQALLANYKAHDKVHLYFNKTDIGQFPNRNLAASYAKGKYIKYLDSDDLIYPHGLEVMVKAMEQFPKGGIGLSFNSYDEQEPLPVLFSTEKSFINHFFKRGILGIGPSGCIYKRDYFEKIGGFNPEFKVAADYDFNTRAAGSQPIVLFQRDLFWWRHHDGQEITLSTKNNEYVILNYLIHKKNVQNAQLNKEIKLKILKNNEILMGRRLLKLALKITPKEIKRICKVTNFKTKSFFRSMFPTNKMRT
ncbi:MAG: glycosyltransferase involved in cell wall biosynthesis [Psychroserpens sp.]|jgi:glycosyltransferase involved in cell wall biosynthesis